MVSQVSQETETPEQRERALWTQYLDSLQFQQETWMEYQHVWHWYIATGLRNDDARQEWETLSRLMRKCRQRVDEAMRAWKQVAYPVYNLAHLLKDEDEQQSS